MQVLLEQLRLVSPERADVLFRGEKFSTSHLRRLLSALDTTAYQGKHSSQANLWLLLKVLGAEPKLGGVTWSGGNYIFPRNKPIGHGTFAQVYRCGDCALKQIKLVKRDTQEVQALLKAQHTHIVQLKDWWFEAGRLVILTNFAQGGSLRGQLKQPLPIAQRIGEQLLSAVAYLHENQLVHRDIKPSNMAWDAQRQHLTLLDFGLAGSSTTASTWRGTLPYSLAEMWRQRFRQLDRGMLERNDVWACWATLWAVAMGRGPYRRILNLDELKELFLKPDADIVELMEWRTRPCEWACLQEELCAMSNQKSADAVLALIVQKECSNDG